MRCCRAIAVAMVLVAVCGLSSCGLFGGNRPGDKDPQRPYAESLGDYRLAAGKVIYLSIYEGGRSTMAVDLVVDPSGNLHVPVFGEASVTGMTPLDAAKKIEYLARDTGQHHLRGPRVHVKALDRRAVVHVTGHVKRPGPVTYFDGLTVAEAIEAAGGVDEQANPGSVGLTNAGRKKIVTTPDTRELEEGDVVEVPRRF